MPNHWHDTKKASPKASQLLDVGVACNVIPLTYTRCQYIGAAQIIALAYLYAMLQRGNLVRIDKDIRRRIVPDYRAGF